MQSDMIWHKLQPPMGGLCAGRMGHEAGEHVMLCYVMDVVFQTFMNDQYRYTDIYWKSHTHSEQSKLVLQLFSVVPSIIDNLCYFCHLLPVLSYLRNGKRERVKLPQEWHNHIERPRC